MKIKLITLLLVFISVSMEAQIKSPQPSPSSKVEQKIGLTDVTLEYSRPSMRGRKIFGNLVPFGEKWRNGANANSKITFSTDVVIDGKDLKKGTYAIYSIPNKDAWEIIFYSDANNGGLPRKWDDAKVAVKTSVKTETIPFTIETFEMGFDNLADPNFGSLFILWENTLVSVKIKFPTDALTMKSIEKVFAGPSGNDYFGAASYYYSADKDLNKALEWVNKAVEMNPKAFWMTRQKSLIQAKMGDKKNAIATANTSLKVAQKAGNMDYVKMNKDSIAEWSK
ncbi:MAG: DUF2911 domain-containing protein [Flavobacteriaceae bacterium]|nr:DUF2911 domain-containing protein [Flavobacteriaceae bacterium]